MCGSVRKRRGLKVEATVWQDHDYKLNKLICTFSAKQKELFDDCQETVAYIDSLIAIENRRIGFEEGMHTAQELLDIQTSPK
jgi:hypothetical protein